MGNFVSILLPTLAVFILLRIIALPIRWFWKLSVNSACGFCCLWLLNALAVYTSLYFPINSVTVIVAGFLGLPGIAALALIQFFL